MTTVTYDINATVKQLSASPALPAGYALETITLGELNAFAGLLDGKRETVTGDTLTDRMRRLKARIEDILDAASTYEGPKIVHVNNSDVGTDGAWTSSAEVCVHPRGEDVGSVPTVCAAQDAQQAWQIALVHAVEL
jgi:hypothetical protein